MRKHIIIATYDGIGTHYSGVGTIAKNLVFALTKLSDKYDLRVSIAYINVNKQSKVFNEQCFEDSSNLVNKTGGALVPLCNSSKGESEWDMWRSFEEWDFANVSLVTSLNLLLNNDEENILILNDTPFLMFAKFRELLNVKNIKLFYFPLSTGINHNFGPDRWRNKRIKLFPLQGVKTALKYEKQTYDMVAKLFLIESFDIFSEILKQQNPISYLIKSYLYSFYIKKPKKNNSQIDRLIRYVKNNLLEKI